MQAEKVETFLVLKFTHHWVHIEQENQDFSVFLCALKG